MIEFIKPEDIAGIRYGDRQVLDAIAERVNEVLTRNAQVLRGINRAAHIKGYNWWWAPDLAEYTHTGILLCVKKLALTVCQDCSGAGGLWEGRRPGGTWLTCLTCGGSKEVPVCPTPK